MNNLNYFQKALAIIMLVAIVAGCSAVSGRETPGEYIDDAAITAKVKAAIIDDNILHPFQISVETFQNVVQLRGFVDSQKIAARASVVAKVKGVKAVKNDIIVRKNK